MEGIKVNNKMYYFCQRCQTNQTEFGKKHCIICEAEDIRIYKYLKGERPKRNGRGIMMYKPKRKSYKELIRDKTIQEKWESFLQNHRKSSNL